MNKVQVLKSNQEKYLTVTAMKSIDVAPLLAMSLCKYATITLFHTAWPQRNNQHNICHVTDSPPCGGETRPFVCT